MIDNLLAHPQIMELAFDTEISSRLINNFPEVERVSGIGMEEFVENYIKPEKLVIITDLTDHWPARKKWNLDYLNQICGNILVETNLYSTQDKKVKFSQFIEALKTGKTDSQMPLYLQEWYFADECPELLEDVRIPKHIHNDMVYKIYEHYLASLWVGEEGSTTILHQDYGATHAWHAQIVGEKQWYFFGREAELTLDNDGKPDFEQLMNDPKSKPSHCLLKPGELLFMPCYTWHRVVTQSLAMSFCVHFVTENNLVEFVRRMTNLYLEYLYQSEELKKTNFARYKVYKSRIETLSKWLKIIS